VKGRNERRAQREPKARAVFVKKKKNYETLKKMGGLTGRRKVEKKIVAKGEGRGDPDSPDQGLKNQIGNGRPLPGRGNGKGREKKGCSRGVRSKPRGVSVPAVCDQGK